MLHIAIPTPLSRLTSAAELTEIRKREKSRVNTQKSPVKYAKEPCITHRSFCVTHLLQNVFYLFGRSAQFERIRPYIICKRALKYTERTL